MGGVNDDVLVAPESVQHELRRIAAALEIIAAALSSEAAVEYGVLRERMRKLTDLGFFGD